LSSAVTGTPPAATVLRPASERGTTTMADRVIVAVAARAAAEVPGIGGVTRRVLGIPVDGQRSDRAPQVEAAVAGDTVALRVRLSVVYPTPVGAVTKLVRQHVAEQVGMLTGKRVGVVDVTVMSLPLPAAPPRVIR
jgi:uncharacterized alkaline shock family protein YloU